MKYPSLIIILFAVFPAVTDNLNDSSIQQLDTIKVIAGIINEEVIVIPERESEIGIYDDVNEILFMTPGINRVPEAGSQLLIHGGSIYDNIYMFNEVPMFVPAHFSGHSFMDINNILVPALQRFHMVTGDIPGNYAGASSGVIKVEPGFFQVSREKWTQRPQILLTLGTYDAGLCVSVPFRKGTDIYQLTVNAPNAYLIQYKVGADNSYIWWDISYYDEHKHPQWFEDITFCGKTGIKNAVLKEQVWLALDAYSSPGSTRDEIIPWGVGSITLEDADRSKRWRITGGGSHQYANQKRILGTLINENRVIHSNGSFLGELNNITVGPFLLKSNLRSEYLNWNANARVIRKGGTVDNEKVGQKEVFVTAHAGLQSGVDRFLYGIDLLGGGMVYEDYSLFIDPGVWTRINLNNGYISAHGGINTSWPDVRGMPSQTYRSRQIKTYMGSLSFQKDFLSRFKVLLQGYVKWKDHGPALHDHPAVFRWEPANATPLLTMGISGELSIDLSRCFSFRLLHDFNRSRRKKDGIYTTYEWEIPWSLRPIFNVVLFHDKLDIFLSGVFSEGLPYNELALYASGVRFIGMKRVPWYKRIDLKMQFSQPIEEHRFFTSFNVFLDIINILDVLDRFRQTQDHYWENIREYYWNEYMVKKPVFLERSTVSLGVRASFRL